MTITRTIDQMRVVGFKAAMTAANDSGSLPRLTPAQVVPAAAVDSGLHGDAFDLDHNPFTRAHGIFPSVSVRACKRPAL
jgi:hypothetical protein